VLSRAEAGSRTTPACPAATWSAAHSPPAPAPAPPAANAYSRSVCPDSSAHRSAGPAAAAPALPCLPLCGLRAPPGPCSPRARQRPRPSVLRAPGGGWGSGLVDKEEAGHVLLRVRRSLRLRLRLQLLEHSLPRRTASAHRHPHPRALPHATLGPGDSWCFTKGRAAERAATRSKLSSAAPRASAGTPPAPRCGLAPLGVRGGGSHAGARSASRSSPAREKATCGAAVSAAARGERAHTVAPTNRL